MNGVTYPNNTVSIFKTKNGGFIVNTKGTREQQHDNLDGVYVFRDISELTDFIADYYKKTDEEKS